MKIVKRGLLALLLAACSSGIGYADGYGLPTNIQDGNILHCFDWTIAEVKADLKNIAAAGYGAVQLSPLQRSDVRKGSPWHDLYRPYDIAFKGGLGTEAELKALCDEAATYGIKVIVDVVANHVDKTSGYHDTWWDSNGRVRWEGGINYGNRYSVTHGQLGDYGDVNSESSEVQARAKAYIEKLHSLGVKGIRWDAAKHIGLPSEGCNFWSTVTSVPGMYHYGEILNDDGTPIAEYAKYMSVTDNRYSNGAAQNNGGIQQGYGGEWVVNRGVADNKVVYWGESHDTYSNDEWSQNVDQSVIDRAYACVASRNGATALYFARPDAKGFGNIKVGKGNSTAYRSQAITAVNQFRNAMVGKADYCTATGNAFSVTRQNGGAVIVMKGSGNVTIANGGGYCPAGTYTDKVSGGTFTVTASTISGNVGASGIAVIYNGGDNPNPPTPPTPPVNDDDDPATFPAINGVYLKNTSNWSQPCVWAWSGQTNCTASGNWPGDNMTKYNDTYWKWEVPAGKSTPAEIIFNPGSDNGKTADLTYVNSAVYDCSGQQIAVAQGGDTPNPPTPPTPGEGFTVYFDNSTSNWSVVNCYAWNAGASDQNAAWPGAAMESIGNNVYKYTSSTTYANVIFNNGSTQTDDLTAVNGHIYKADGSHQEYGGNVGGNKPVVTASPASCSFAESVTVTLSVNPATTIYYTIDGSTPSASSKQYSSALTFTSTTTLKTFVKNDGGENVQTFTYTKSNGPVPPTPQPGNNLITDYYKVNPNGQVGERKTINMSFSNQNATSAMSHWSASDIIAQGVARDVCQAMKGNHERPVVDSYAIYAAYDNDNLYLGVQFVYTVWDLYGEGKQPGESKPYNMDGRLMWAFDLDPNKSFDGYIDGTKGIWNDNNQPGAKFENGVDAVWIGSTKPGVGTPGFFIPTPAGHASYDAAYCKSISGSYYGYADGLHPSISAIYGQGSFNFEPEVLTGNDGFVDLKGEIAESAHTFYEWKLPLSVLGVTADYIQNTGIGVMYLDVYGCSPVGGTPYDPSYFDNVKDSYSMDPSSSKEKEDEDVITYAPARVGKLLQQSGVENIAVDPVDENAPVEYYTLQGVRVMEPAAGTVVIVRRGNTVSKQIFR